MSDEEIDEQAMRDAVASVLEDSCGTTDVAKYAAGDGSLNIDLKRNAAAMGWTGIMAPESAGGSDLRLGRLILLYEELGSHLAPLPMLGQQLCIKALLETGQTGNRSFNALVSGTCWAAADIPTGTPSFSLDPQAGSTYLLRGEAQWVLDDGTASYLLTFAKGDSDELHALWLDTASLGRSPLPVHDRTRQVLTIHANSAAVYAQSIIARGPAAEALRERLLTHAALALAADSVGGATKALQITVEYLKIRFQFGRPIGSFQALKHRAATMKIALERISALLDAAIDATFDIGNKHTQLASLAKARAADAYLAIASESVQLHGGIGFTRESPCHLFLKRAKHSQLLFGDSSWHLDRCFRLGLQA